MRRSLAVVLAIAISAVAFFASPAGKSLALDIPWIQVAAESATFSGNRSTPSTLTLGSGYSIGIFFTTASLTGNITGVQMLGNCHSNYTGGSMTLSGSSTVSGHSASATYSITLAAGTNDCVAGLGGSHGLNGTFTAHKTAHGGDADVFPGDTSGTFTAIISDPFSFGPVSILIFFSGPNFTPF